MACRTGKKRFRDELGAKIFLAKLVVRDKGESRIYPCKFCKGYHLTSQDQKTKRITPLGIAS